MALSNLDHIGIAVNSLAEGLQFYRDTLGMRLECTEEVPSEKVRVAILYSGDTRVELLEPTSDDSPIALFLKKRGPGVHHLAFSTENMSQSEKDLRAKAVQVIEPFPRLGAHQCTVGFIHPKESKGVLIELVERPS